MKRWILFLLFLPLPVQAGNLISSATWSESGDYKLARQDQYPYNVSSNTISRVWDGTNIKLFSGLGELVTWVTYLNCSAGGNANNVMVAISSFTGTGTAAGSGIIGINVSSTSVWDFSQRPYALYKYEYIQQIGMGTFGAWDPTEYDENQVPPRWRRPCTNQGPGECSPNGGTNFLNRPDANKFYPAPAVPIEEFQISSFTVFASSSQAIGGEVYVSTSLPAGTYTATLTVTEGISVSTTIPIQLLVYNAILPPIATLPVIADLGYSDLDIRLTGTRFPANDQVDPYFTNHARVAAFLHRHKVIPVGDPNTAGQDYPNLEYQQHINGIGYKETYGLSSNSSPGYAVGDPFYMIGQYGSWKTGSWSTTVTGGASGYCTNVSSWVFSCNQRGINCQLYTSNDEASPTILAGEVNRESVWNSTAPSCSSGGKILPYFQTGALDIVKTSAPYVNTVVSTGWMGVSSTTWANDEALYNSGASTSAAGGYNDGIGVDSLFESQEEGLGPREVLWGAKKTNQKYWFLWEINYWQDSNNGGQTQNGFNSNTNNDNNLYKNSKTFGYDVFPSTDNVKGHFGFGFSNNNGNMLFPSSDTISGYSSYGFNGVIGSWNLNQLTRGIQDVDIISLANSVNPSATNAIVNQQVQDVMYLRQCYLLSDCTYSYGKRPWNEVINSWELARESLLQIASGASPPPTVSETLQGKIQLNGGIKLR